MFDYVPQIEDGLPWASASENMTDGPETDCPIISSGQLFVKDFLCSATKEKPRPVE